MNLSLLCIPGDNNSYGSDGNNFICYTFFVKTSINLDLDILELEYSEGRQRLIP